MGTSTQEGILLKVIITMGILRVTLLLCAVIVLSEAFTCPSGWSLYNRRCFQFSNSLKMWGDAEKKCLSLGGNLASIHSLEEHNFIRSLIKKGSGSDKLTWIGGSDAAQEGTWLWSGGLPMKYTNWGAGQPDNSFKRPPSTIHLCQGCMQLTNQPWIS